MDHINKLIAQVYQHGNRCGEIGVMIVSLLKIGVNTGKTLWRREGEGEG